MFRLHYRITNYVIELRWKTKFSDKRGYDTGDLQVYEIDKKYNNREDLLNAKTICYILLRYFCDKGSLEMLCGYYNKVSKLRQPLTSLYFTARADELLILTTSAKEPRFTIPLPKMGL